MAEGDRPLIRVWRWVDLSPAGQRAYVLMMAVKLLRSREFQVPDSWLKAWRDAGLSMRGDQPIGGDALGASVAPDGVETELRLTSQEWERLGSMSPEEPLDLLMIHKAAIEYVVSERGNAVPAGLVEITRALANTNQ
jgi:hypothetical protein